MPYPIAYAILHRAKIESFNELPKDKRPPRDLWSKPFKLEAFFDEVFKRTDGQKEYVDLDLEEVE
jgi:hypothetical protein